MTYLDTEVPLFRNYMQLQSSRARLGDFLYDPSHENEVVRLREIQDKGERDIYKAMLPCVMVSCYSDSRAQGSVFFPTGLICVDIDAKDNPGVLDWAQFILGDLSQIPVVTYAGLSVSGRGCFAIIPVTDPGSHLGHFRALEAEFRQFGIMIDPSGKNINRLRGYSYNDENTSFSNPNASRYTKIADPPKPKPNHKPMGNEVGKVQQAVSRIVSEKRDITTRYEDWIRIGLSLASAFGERGRGWYHDLSQFHPEYDPDLTDRKYDSFLNRYDRIGLGTFFMLCK
jgi:hypothetical protein